MLFISNILSLYCLLLEIAITSTDDSKTKKAVTQFVSCDKYMNMYEKCVKYRIKVLKDVPHNIPFF